MVTLSVVMCCQQIRLKYFGSGALQAQPDTVVFQAKGQGFGIGRDIWCHLFSAAASLLSRCQKFIVTSLRSAF